MQYSPAGDSIPGSASSPSTGPGMHTRSHPHPSHTRVSASCPPPQQIPSQYRTCPVSGCIPHADIADTLSCSANPFSVPDSA
eukprot:3940501-Rhodomonas_salina.6